MYGLISYADVPRVIIGCKRYDRRIRKSEKKL